MSTTTGLPALPHNVLIFSPTKAEASQSLLGAKIFTKLATSSRTTPDQIKNALSLIKPQSEETSDVSTFCLPFRKGILIFDGGLPSSESLSQEGLIDAHHENFRKVCLALKDAEINLDFSACIFDAEGGLNAGFQFDGMKGGAVLVIDLMDRGDEDDSSDDDDEDEDEDEAVTEAKLKALVGGNTVEAQ